MQTYLHTNASYNYLDQTCDGFSSIKTKISGSVFLPLKVNRQTLLKFGLSMRLTRTMMMLRRTMHYYDAKTDYVLVEKDQ